MTWRTEIGDRCLAGPEARLIREIVGYMGDMIAAELDYGDDDDGLDYGIPVFDKLAPAQKLSLLEQVLRQLLTPTDKPPELTAMNEGVIAAIYAAVGQMVVSEIEMEPDLDEVGTFDARHWRKLLLDVALADGGHRPSCRPLAAVTKANGNACWIQSQCGSCGTTTIWTPRPSSTPRPTLLVAIAGNLGSSGTTSSPSPRTRRSQTYQLSANGFGRCADTHDLCRIADR